MVHVAAKSRHIASICLRTGQNSGDEGRLFIEGKCMRKLLAAIITATLVVAAPLSAMAGSASLILDARTGKVLSSENADVLNHPASLTKMMTIYMAFEAIKRGKISWNTRLVMSKYAASRPPTKLGAKAGTSITVRDAILGM